jgi:hypothetical protein
MPGQKTLSNRLKDDRLSLPLKMKLRNVCAFIFPTLPDPDLFLTFSIRHKTIEILLNLTNLLVKNYNLHGGKSQKKQNMKQEVKKWLKHA